MIDWNRVAEMKSEFGEDDFREVVEMFLDEVNSEIETLTGDLSAQELEAKLHFLKGAALNLGLQGFADLCRSGEDSARIGKVEAIDTNVIVACYHASIEAFESALPDNAAA